MQIWIQSSVGQKALHLRKNWANLALCGTKDPMNPGSAAGRRVCMSRGGGGGLCIQFVCELQTGTCFSLKFLTQTHTKHGHANTLYIRLETVNAVPRT